YGPKFLLGGGLCDLLDGTIELNDPLAACCQSRASPLAAADGRSDRRLLESIVDLLDQQPRPSIRHPPGGAPPRKLSRLLEWPRAVRSCPGRCGRRPSNRGECSNGWRPWSRCACNDCDQTTANSRPSSGGLAGAYSKPDGDLDYWGRTRPGTRRTLPGAAAQIAADDVTQHAMARIKASW